MNCLCCNCSHISRLQGEHGKLQTEYDKMKDEYATLAAKNQLFVFKYGQDGDVIEKGVAVIL